VLAGLLNTSNTFGSLKGTDELFESETTNKDYMTTFSITGLSTMVAGVFGLVAYAPYVSSIGFLRQMGILDRLLLIYGSFVFFFYLVYVPVFTLLSVVLCSLLWESLIP